MQDHTWRAIFMALAVFPGFLIQKMISGTQVTIKTMLPAIAGGLVAGMVTYFFGIWFLKMKK